MHNGGGWGGYSAPPRLPAEGCARIQRPTLTLEAYLLFIDHEAQPVNVLDRGEYTFF